MTWNPIRAGDPVWCVVTDHPAFPQVVYEGEPYLFREKAVAERIACAWNSYSGDWTWYVKAFVVQPRTASPSAIAEINQMKLF